MLFLRPTNLVKTSGIITGITLIIECIENVMIIVYMYKAKKAFDSNIIENK